MKCRYFFALVIAMLLCGCIVAAEEPQEPADWPQFHRDAARSGNRPTARLKLPLERVPAFKFPSPIYASRAAAGEGIICCFRPK